MKGAPQPVPRERVIPADLTDWQYRAGRGQLGVDPVLGRLVFPVNQLPRRGVWVTYHYAFSADMGGGEYPRPLAAPRPAGLYKVAKDNPAPDTYDTIGGAIAAWRKAQQGLGTEPSDPDAKANWAAQQAELRSAVIEIQDSAVYAEPLIITLEAGESLEIRAANRRRPIIRLLDYMASGSDALLITGKAGSRFSLDGIIVSGRGLQVRGPDRGGEPYGPAEDAGSDDLCDVHIRHCTLVPGWGLECDCEPKRPNEPSLEIFNTRAAFSIEHSIIGTIHVVADEVQTDPVRISITDSIVDATSNDRVAIGAPNLPFAFAVLTILRTTVFGDVQTHAIELAGNSIFMGTISVARRQLGCVRFCYVTPGSRTPRRYHCQPDLVRAAVAGIEPPLGVAERALRQERETARVRPLFTSCRYGSPAYAQLALDGPPEIARGADDESEMGAFHDVFGPQREANLRVRLDEFTPTEMQADILFAT